MKSLLVSLLSHPLSIFFFDDDATYIINVTSPEGQFYTMSEKTDDHVQNNTSKAALIMLTRSAANYYASKVPLPPSLHPAHWSFSLSISPLSLSLPSLLSPFFLSPSASLHTSLQCTHLNQLEGSHNEWCGHRMGIKCCANFCPSSPHHRRRCCSDSRPHLHKVIPSPLLFPPLYFCSFLF
jgi:hypothetical protein